MMVMSPYDVFNQYVLTIERDVVLYYPESKEECPNCVFYTVGVISRSVSIYKEGGPVPFDAGTPCPYCDGKGYRAVEKNESIKTRIYVNSKDWNNKTMSLKLPSGSIQLISRMEFLPQIRAAKYLIPKYNGLEQYQTDIYYRTNQIYSDSFVLNPQKYITTYWTKNHDEADSR